MACLHYPGIRPPPNPSPTLTCQRALRADDKPAAQLTSEMTLGGPDHIFSGSQQRARGETISRSADVPGSPGTQSRNRGMFLSLQYLISRSRVKKGPENPISVVDGKPEGVRERPMTHPSASITRCPQAGTPVPGCPPAGGAGTTVARTCTVRATVPSWCPPGGRPSPWTAPSWPGGHRAVPARGFGSARLDPAPGRADLTGRAESRVDACGPGREASPPRRPAAGPAGTAPGNGGAGPAVTVRDPAPGPAGLPLRQGQAACRALPVRSRGTSRPRDRLSGPAWLPFSAGGRPLVSVPSGGPGAGGGRT